MKTFDEISSKIKELRAAIFQIQTQLTNFTRYHGIKCQNCDFYKTLEGTNPPFFYCTASDHGESWPECFWPNEEWRKKHGEGKI